MNKKYLYFPLKIILIYLSITMFLYAFGPIAWKAKRPITLWMLLFAYFFSFAFGWLSGVRAKVREDRWSEIKTQDIVCLLPGPIIINFLYEFVVFLRRMMIKSPNMHELITKTIYSITHMGRAYDSFQEQSHLLGGADVFGGVLFSYFALLFEFVALVILLLSTIFFKHFHMGIKIVIVLTYSVISLSYLSTGTTIGLARIILIVACVIFFKFLQKIYTYRELDTKERRKQRKKRKYIVIFAVLIVIGVLLLFDIIMKSRSGIYLWKTSTYNIGGYGINRNSILFKILPSSLHMLLVSLSSYLTQGYQGMALSLDIPWEPTFGLGSSAAWTNLLKDIIPFIRENSYQFRLTSHGWDEYTRWHSMYSWFANDWTYLGVIFFMFIFGYLFALAYKDYVCTNNPYALVILYYFTLEVLFAPCNNQVFQTTYTCFSFYFALILWLCTRGRKIKLRFRKL